MSSRLSIEQRVRWDNTHCFIACGLFQSLTTSKHLKHWSVAWNQMNRCANERNWHSPA
jgi:hypothetical protein